MASAAEKKRCAQCGKAGEIVVSTCDGCQQLSCDKHINEHRHELARQIDNVGQEHDLLQNLNGENDAHLILSRIDAWEQESITRVQVAAEAARTDLRELISRTKNERKALLGKLADELQSNRKSDDYTENDINRWIQQLKGLREIMEKPSNVEIVEESNGASIHLIKVRENCSQQQPHAFLSERFDKAVGAVALSQDGLMAWHVDYIGSNGSTSGVNLYSSGTHHIRFRLEGDWGHWFFSGIIPSSQEMVADASRSRSVYGWWDFENTVINGKQQSVGKAEFIEKDDEMTLTLNCGKKQIELEHHRTNSLTHLPVDLRVCPFPWKLLVGFDWRGGCVHILR
ncbi:unnamed protein product [Didymodactylos carnosus]|uniref:B box-type domain-containing protein n=1 Tax=Didymodactylos carnosus TaxID=1234261 RepID=A0A814X5I7_9BILA|nr:unnamed protein product [Didymodactylos carnosus]CAF1459810.1 unnamed protein product [Didymodactylos carnosus]CAF3975579.1 unnamed protein product [Didymodactylos carnosus]CAF4253330.1 unnamed protein product [Didymodactylos carnosus]